MAADQAERRAAALRAGGDDQPAGGGGVAAPDAAGTDVVGSAVGAAGFSFVSFAAGAAIPILPFLVTTGTAAILAAAIVVGVALFATGATVGCSPADRCCAGACASSASAWPPRW
jgi:VIT1/CCC1 family predicted Fe2+/Mn2+ transporter